MKTVTGIFQVLKNLRCESCGGTVKAGAFIGEINGKAVCMECAEMKKLVFLKSGDHALTIRSKKLSASADIVLKWNSARKRYYRTGMMVEKSALEKAKKMCMSDIGERLLARKKAALRAEKSDLIYVKSFAEKILILYPGSGKKNAQKIAEHACRKYSGRVGRSGRAKKLEEKPIRLSVRAYVRHKMTSYDKLFEKGYKKEEARMKVNPRVDKKVELWKTKVKTVQNK
jgi:hypothetical protein